MTTSNAKNTATSKPAAALLFQAPEFPAVERGTDEDRERGAYRGEDRQLARESRRGNTSSRRGKKKGADERSVTITISDDSGNLAHQKDSESEGGGRRGRLNRNQRGNERSDSEISVKDNDEEANHELSDSEDSTSRRRRRRRPRGTSTRGENAGERLEDQVTPLSGSTRLQAKKMRKREGRREHRQSHVITESEFIARREAVNREMIIRHQDGLDQIALVEDEILVEHYVSRHSHQSLVGNIYLGRVQNVLPSMEAAFVDLGTGRNAVLYAGEVNWEVAGLDGRPRRIESAMKSGDAVLVQVTKDPIGHKGPRLTSQITLAGRHLVLIPGASMMGISRRLPENERSRLKKILVKLVPDGYGVIVRTAAEGATEEQLAEDIERLTQEWEVVERKKKNTKAAPVLLRGEPELALRVVRDVFNEDFTKLVIQGDSTYQKVKEYLTDLSSDLTDRVEKWVGSDDIFASYRIDEQLTKGMDQKVWLPSGGTLIIDRTEAMTVIDINTGKFIGSGGTLEETVTRNNLEAAEEIVRQLRLRDIGGIIIIDFVDMVLESNRDLVLRRLLECLGRDRTRHQVTEITSLGLVQMTRKRVGEGLVEAFSTRCEACEGRGFIVHAHPVELVTGSSSGKNPHSPRKGKKQVEEPHRIDSGPEHERTKQALNLIAGAPQHGSSESQRIPKSRLHSSHVDHQDGGSIPQSSIQDEDVLESNTAVNAVGEDSGADSGGRSSVNVHKEKKRKKGRRGHTKKSTDPAADSSARLLLERASDGRPEHRGRGKNAHDSLVDTRKVDKNGTDRRSDKHDAGGVQDDLVAKGRNSAPKKRVTSRAVSTGAVLPRATAATNLPKKNRRRVVSTSVVDPTVHGGVSDRPSATVFHSSLKTKKDLKTLADIRLPEVGEHRTVVKRRRRVATTGVVDIASKGDASQEL